MYEGTLGGSRICIKRLREYTKDGSQEPMKVCSSAFASCLPPLTRLAEVLPRGRYVETLETPKYLTPPGYHYHSPPTHLELDVRWGPTRLHQKILRC